MTKKVTKIFSTLLMVIISAIALAACGGANTSALSLSQEEVATQAADLQLDAQALIESESKPDEVVSTTPGEVVSATPDELPVIPRINKGGDWFEPTNPLDVDIISGSVQIIEFSAYW